ncbi:hypothetical protein [Streptomyces sp. RKAG293]|uniref:hypothetical protein n=1 Tax=Streptomyces sp. RKAG293 TaxID=2893403 RepID=UPI00203320ED|nr:hypothetical protein [Streptomyces sp. RKAG293]MCM2420223.1 hypothetical protein [Streptomyces sp. RKAG293]
MDLQGVGALVAAGVAAVSVPATLLIGRWQTKAAVQTARAATAQAEATYRAALDAVRVQGLNEYDQWRRGIQRDAYASLLQAVLNYTEHATNVFGQSMTDPHQFPALIAASKPLATDMSHKRLVVRLEGPEEVSAAALSLVDTAEALMQTCRDWASSGLARTLLDERGSAHRREVDRIKDLIATFRIRGYWSLIGTPQLPDDAAAILRELRSLLRAVDMSGGHIASLCNEQSAGAYGDAASTLDSAIGHFLTVARTTLHRGPHPVTDPLSPADPSGPRQ